MQPWDDDLNTDNMGDDGALYIDFSSDEASSESRDREPLPDGKYLMVISECRMKPCGPDSKNPGKPMYVLEFTVVEDKAGGKFLKRKAFTNAMLFSPALFTITHIMKATGFNVSEGRVRIPTAEELIGKVLVVGGQKKGPTKSKTDPNVEYPARFEPSYFAKEETWKRVGGTVTTRAGSTDAASLLS